jgi:2-polyprenyl-3-methyl-5-hydroxy-6-metoxy-1,4-benzoquinol methylase
MVKSTDHVLEIGCGPERPLARILLNGIAPRAATYTGVDLNKLAQIKHTRQTIIGEFDFTKRYRELARPDGYDVAVHMEVIEHMKVEHGRKLLKGCFELLRPGGIMLTSTPCYDGRRHAANHIHEYTIPELQKHIEKAGFVIEQRFGTFIDIKHLKTMPGVSGPEAKNVVRVAELLGRYFDCDALSCIFAPLNPDHARNNLWVCRKPS